MVQILVEDVAVFIKLHMEVTQGEPLAFRAGLQAGETVHLEAAVGQLVGGDAHLRAAGHVVYPPPEIRVIRNIQTVGQPEAGIFVGDIFHA